MKLITDDDVAFAERQALLAADTHMSTLRTWPHLNLTVEQQAVLAEARQRAEIAAARVVHLRDQQQQQQAELAGRDALEQQAGDYLTAAGSELTKSRKTVAGAVAKAERALLDAVRAAEAHDRLVAEHRTRVADLGLIEVDGHEFPTSAAGRGVRIRGTEWTRVQHGDVLARIAGRVAASVLGRSHAVGMLLAKLGQQAGGLERSGLLADVPELPPHADSRPRMPRTAVLVDDTLLKWTSRRGQQDWIPRSQLRMRINFDDHGREQRIAVRTLPDGTEQEGRLG